MKRLYTLSVSANLHIDGAVRVEFKAAVCMASYDEEAVGIGVGISKEEYPIDEGWCGHAAACCPVPIEMIVSTLAHSHGVEID